LEKLSKKKVEDYWKLLKKKKNVVGIDSSLQPKEKDGKEYIDIPSIRIYVSKKVPMKDVTFCASFLDKIKRKIDKNPPKLLSCDLVPFDLDGIPTDIIEVGEMKALNINRDKHRPVKGGTSSMHYRGGACSTTGFFRDPETNKIYVASNCHCYGQENKANIGDSILQPSPSDGGVFPRDEIASVSKIIPLKFEEYTCFWRRNAHKLMIWEKKDLMNTVDISFGEITAPWVAEATIIGAYKGKREPFLGEDVHKSGRTTGYTVGTVASLSYTGTVQYDRGRATFTDCILIQGNGFSEAGDSGSPVFDTSGNFIGALFAGSTDYAIICKVSNIELESNLVLIIKEEN